MGYQYLTDEDRAAILAEVEAARPSPESIVKAAEAAHYRSVAAAKGQDVQVLNVTDGGHFDIIAPGSKAWEQQVRPFLAKALMATP